MSEHNAIDTRTETRPLWMVFVLLFVTGGLYRTYWAWRSATDLSLFGRERPGRVSADDAIRPNPGGLAFATFLLLPGAALLLVAISFALDSVPAEYGIDQPSTEELLWTLGIAIALVVPALVATLRLAGHVRAARRLAGLEPATFGLGRGFVPLLLVELVGIPATNFVLQHALNDLWSRYPPLLDEDLYGELAPPDQRAAAIARRPELHDARLARIATELEHPRVIPWVTIAFGALCVGVFAFQLWYHGPFPTSNELEEIGGYENDLDGTWWRFWTANVLHGSIQHLAGNLFAWALVGAIVERVVGHARMVALVIIGAVGCSLGTIVADPGAVSIGASGVVFASFGLAAMVDPLARRSVGKLGWSLVALGIGLSTFAPGVSSGGHVGGVAAGLVLGGVVTFAWRVQRPDAWSTSAALRRRPAVDPSAPLAPMRELTISERLAHLEARRGDGGLAEREFERLRHALVEHG